MNPTHRKLPSARRAARIGIEALGARLVLANAGGAAITLAGQVLTIEGTNGPDRVAISPARPAGAIRVAVNGSSRVYDGVGSLVVRVGGGDDVVNVDRRITLPARIEGGVGNDRIRAGAGPEVVLGGDGDDTLIGTGGRASLDGGGGRDRIVLARPLGTIRVGRSASGEAARILGKGYGLAPLAGSGGSYTGPVVVGAADLDDGGVVAQLRASYAAGQTVAITNATPREAERLRVLVGQDAPVGWAADIPRADLVAFRKSAIDGSRSQSEATVVLPRVDATPGTALSAREARAGRNEADAGLLGRLTTVFAATPTVAAPPSGVPNLLNLTSVYESKSIQTDTIGDQLQVVNQVYGARSFLNSSDFYYVLQEVDLHLNATRPSVLSGQSTNTIVSPSTAPTVIQSSPQSTQKSTSVTSGVSTTIGGSIGFNEAQGFNASISGSVTISNSVTTTYPPISLANATDLAAGVPRWDMSILAVPATPGETDDFYNQWIWQVPFTAYAAGQTSLAYNTQAALYTRNESPITPAVTINLDATVPVPFGDTFTLLGPTVTSVSKSVVDEGATFTIAGTGLYPSLVTGVLIGGTPLPAANYQVVSDKEITVIAPARAGLFDPVVVQTTQGVSNDNVTISISPL